MTQNRQRNQNNSLILTQLQTIGDYFIPRRGHTANGYKNRWIIVFGGFSEPTQSNVDLSNDLFIFDTQYLKWKQVKQIGSVPFKRRGHITAIYEHKLILFGGDVEQFEPFSNGDTQT